MRVLLCDDHRLFIDALATSLAARGCTVVARVTHPSEAVEVLRREPVDVCLLDVHFEDVDGIRATRDLLAVAPGLKIVILSADHDRATIADAMDAGAVGYVPKHERTDLVLDVLRRVHMGEVVVRATAARLESDRAARARRLLETLTPREREVLIRLVDGQSTKDIAREMGIRRSTARTHIQHVLSRLGAHSKVEAVVLAVSYDLPALAGARNGDGRRPRAKEPSAAAAPVSRSAGTE